MYDKKRIAGGIASALAVWVVVAMLIMNSGVALGTYPISGVGGFVLAGSAVDAQQLTVYTDTADSRGGETPAAVLEFQNVTIEDFTLAFNLNVSTAPGVDGIISIRFRSIQDANLQAEGVLVKASSARANRAEFTGVIVDESPGTVPSEKLLLTGTGADLTGQVRIQAHYLAVREFTFPAFDLEVWWDNDNDGRYEFGGP